MSLSSWAMMYNFREGMIHPAITSIYNCHRPTWVRQTDVSSQADRGSDSLLHQDTAFLISFTNHFPSNGSSLQSLWSLPRTPPPPAPHPTSLASSHSVSSPAPFLAPICGTIAALKGKKKWHHHNEEPALLEFLLNFLSMTTPGWQPTHPQIFSPVFFFSFLPSVWRSEVRLWSFYVHISPLACRLHSLSFFSHYTYFTIVIHILFKSQIV